MASARHRPIPQALQDRVLAQGIRSTAWQHPRCYELVSVLGSIGLASAVGRRKDQRGSWWLARSKLFYTFASHDSMGLLTMRDHHHPRGREPPALQHEYPKYTWPHIPLQVANCVAVARGRWRAMHLMLKDWRYWTTPLAGPKVVTGKNRSSGNHQARFRASQSSILWSLAGISAFATLGSTSGKSDTSDIGGISLPRSQGSFGIIRAGHPAGAPVQIGGAVCHPIAGTAQP